MHEDSFTQARDHARGRRRLERWFAMALEAYEKAGTAEAGLAAVSEVLKRMAAELSEEETRP